MSYEIIIPWNDPGCPYRSEALEYIVKHYSKKFSVEVFENNEPLNRARLRNKAVESSGHDVVALIDADVFIPLEQVRYAIELAKEKRILVKPYFTVGYASKTTSKMWMIDKNRDEISETDFYKFSVPWKGIHGGAFVINRKDWIDVGGMDENFNGWGGEDNAFNEICAKKLGPIGLIEGYAFHLYHPRTEKMSKENIDLLLTYTKKDKLLPPYFSYKHKTTYNDYKDWEKHETL